MELRTGSRLYWLWASTFRLFWRRPPTETDTCAVLRRVILIPIIWPFGLVVRLGSILLKVLFLIAFFAIGYTVGLLLGYLPARSDDRTYWTWKKYHGWQFGPFELYPWHTIILAAIAWTVWIGWYGYVHWSDKHVPEGLQAGFWITVIVVAIILIIGLIHLLIRLTASGVEWLEALKGRLCTPVTIVDDRAAPRA